MRELEKQSNKKIIPISVADEIYIIKNTYRENAYELALSISFSVKFLISLILNPT